MIVSTILAAACVLNASGRASAQFIYQKNQAPLQKDADHIARHFPDVEGLEFVSPSFANRNEVPATFANGTSGPTPQHVLESYLQRLAARNDWMTYVNPDFTSDEGRSLPYVLLSTSTKPGALMTDINLAGSGVFSGATNATKKLRVLLQGAQHGNEPAGDEGLLAFVGRMDANATWAASILENLDILVLPRYNPDGVAYFQRQLASNLDPNRDHTKMDSPQTRAIKKLTFEFAPHVGIDAHELNAARVLGKTNSYLTAQDGQICGAKNLNIHKDIREIQEGLFANNIFAALERRGLRYSQYMTSTAGTDDIVVEETTGDAKYGDASVGLTQAVMFTLETRGIRLGDQHWQRRIATQITMVEAVVETAAQNYKLVYDTIENARAEFIASKSDVVITEGWHTTNISWTFLDARNGTLVDVPVTFLNTTPATAELTRPRPEAYIFSRAWSRAAALLRDSGVVVEELSTDFSGMVKGLNITNATLARSKYEGIAMTTVLNVTEIERNVSFPAGSFVVSTRQKNAAIAFSVLEPEAVDSYAKFNIIPVNTGDEWQVYRLF